MDKETLSNYGWIVICVLVLAVMIALSGPFGTFVANAVKSTTQGLFDVNQNALGAAGIEIQDNKFADCEHTYENYKCTQCGHIQEHICNYENQKCIICGADEPVVLEMSVWSKLIRFEEGMTWGEWVNSEYNTHGITVEPDKTIKFARNNRLVTQRPGEATYTEVTSDEIMSIDISYAMHNAAYGDTE